MRRPAKGLGASGPFEGSPDESERDRPKREESGRNGPFPGLPSPDAIGPSRATGIAESLVVVGPNETARQDVLTGRSSRESVSIRYTHWSVAVVEQFTFSGGLSYQTRASSKERKCRSNKKDGVFGRDSPGG